jgi:putative heme-binding domain-containing protein
MTMKLTGWLVLAVTCFLGCLSARAQSDDALPALVELLGQTDDAQFQVDLLKGMQEGLKGRRAVPMPSGWEAVANKLEKSQDAQVRDLVQSLSLTFGSSSALIALRKQLLDGNAEVAARKKALESLFAVKDPTLADALRGLLGDRKLRGEALRALAAYEDPKTPPAILGIYRDLNDAEKQDALNTLVSRKAFARELLEGVRAKTVPAKDLTADIVRQLRQFKDAQINKQVETLWGVARESGADKLKELARYKDLIKAGPAGDPSRGRAIFTRTCQQCHTLFDVGGKVGPNITGSNRADLDYLLHNILDPNAEIPNDYLPTVVETKDDRVITGIVTHQDDNALTLITANDTVLVPRTEIQSTQQSQLSMMPEGLIEALSPQEVRDLVSYLQSPAQVPLPADSAQHD